MSTARSQTRAYELARERYAELGVDTEAAMTTLATIPISLHCWQGDDVGGFENVGAELGGGLAVTGNYPGKARTPDELRAEDLLNEIHRQRDLTRKARQEAEDAQRDAKKLKADLTGRLEKIEDERRALLEKARAEAEEEADSLRQEMDEVRRALARARQPLEALRPVQEQVEQIAQTAQKAVQRREDSEVEKHPLRLGEKVRVRSIKMEGVITALGESDVEVQVGNLRVRARLGDLPRRGEAVVEEVKQPVSGRTSLSSAPAASKNASAPAPAEPF